MTTTNARPFETVPDAFRAVVAQHPEGVAYQDRNRSITYLELDLESNAIANSLAELDDRRPLVLVAPVSIESMAAVLGGLKSGRLVAPLDPRWPVEQWLEVARRLDGQLVVPDHQTRDVLPKRAGARALVVSELTDGDTGARDLTLDTDAPALAFFTSGSTGAPKGILVGHGMPLRALDMFEHVEGDRMALIAPLSFITGTLMAVATIATGSSGHMFDVANEDLTVLPRWLVDERITFIGLSVSIAAMLARALLDDGRTAPSLRFLGLGGEAGTSQQFADLSQAFPNSAFLYAYGQTEAGPVTSYLVGSTEEDPDSPLPVGRPFDWVDVAIVDESGQPVANGEFGEIWVTGRHVALGYWDEPALTAEQFETHPDGRRTVRTGDRGRFRSDGMLEVSGRTDRRVKVHGQLVDLSQVEHEVHQLPGIRDAVVSSVPTEDGAHRVVAHIVTDTTPPVTVGELRRGLSVRIPPYAIPRAFFRVDAVPQTITGKVDREWLRESAVGALPLETEYVAPRNEREHAVARLFEETLALDRVGVHDDYFELGGDSLSVVELLAGLAEELDLDLSASDLLRHPTVEAIAGQLAQRDTTHGSVAVKVNDGTGPSWFCVPGAADTPVQYRSLGRRLPHLAIYAFAYRGMDTRAVPDQSVEAIARRNIAAMRELDPSGPYRILGYSFGGAVALEMARQLRAAGDDVERLALLEPSVALAPNDTSRLQQGRAYATRIHHRSVAADPGTDLRARVARARTLTRAGAEYAARQLYLGSAGVMRRRGLPQHEVFFELHIRLLRAHRSARFTGPTLVFASPRYVDGLADVLDELLPPEHAGGNRRDVAIDGEHLDLVREPNVAAVARALEVLIATETV